MADENIAEWAHVFGVEAATIRCVLVAAEAGEIELPPIGERGPRSTEKLPAGGEFSYTAKSIANYLRGNWSEQRVQRCLQVLDKMGDEATETFSGNAHAFARSGHEAAVAGGGGLRTADCLGVLGAGVR